MIGFLINSISRIQDFVLFYFFCFVLGQRPNHNDERLCTTNNDGVSQKLTKYDFARSGALCNGSCQRGSGQAQ